MALTYGGGPLGPWPRGSFNREIPREGLMYFDASPRWIRARLGGETVMDTRRAMLLHEHARMVTYYFLADDLSEGLLVPSERRTLEPGKGEATWWSVRAGDRFAEDSVWGFDNPPAEARWLAGYRGLEWDAFEWLEEDEPIDVHPRDPYHRIDVLNTSRHVRVLIGGEVVADTRRARVLFEAGLPPRWYIPPADVRDELLVPSDKQTTCPYKGHASYWSVSVGETVEEDIAWFYPEARNDATRVEGYIAFFNERADIELDGETTERQTTQWSR